ncbi:uncharacterized protein N7529_009710 [Penicillium soppii]|uniref:uncharacterized protein n=1 Tax=Penicillium soppii TaxID=69789 RepID=UPI002547D849|nr:uncharacterized protein N7529_009710 [Penicillium soppii]KAJ5855766.1 hypothetical protein N7529_009710 [Penicillium soppii]
MKINSRLSWTEKEKLNDMKLAITTKLTKQGRRPWSGPVDGSSLKRWTHPLFTMTASKQPRMICCKALSSVPHVCMADLWDLIEDARSTAQKTLIHILRQANSTDLGGKDV